MQLRQCGVAKAAGGWLPAAAEGRFIAASLIPVPSQPEGSLVHPRELLDPTAQGHGFVQCSVSLPGLLQHNAFQRQTISGAGLSNPERSELVIHSSGAYGNVLICCVGTCHESAAVELCIVGVKGVILHYGTEGVLCLKESARWVPRSCRQRYNQDTV